MNTSILNIYLFILLVLAPVIAEAEVNNDLTELPLETLMEMNVTSVSKKTQSIKNAAAAVFVISQDDIKRSGVTTIAEALRLAPGVQVARIDSNKWAVSTRGFNGRFSNKLLVLMDGRSLYTPYFSGVYWEVQDTLLEDIERIEVIRGPGAALWGSNAVNGVINIITKPAENSHGTTITAGAGSYEKEFASARIGSPIGNFSNLRVYAKGQNRGNFIQETGNVGEDHWQKSQAGFRMDSQPEASNTFTFQGDYYKGLLHETNITYDTPTSVPQSNYRKIINNSVAVSGGNLLGRWQHDLSDTNNTALQLYYDHSEYGMYVSPQIFNIVDADFQQHVSLTPKNDIVWGAGYRFSRYEVQNTPTLLFTDTSVTNSIYSLFLNDEITLIPSSLYLILGSRFEHTDYAGFSAQPNGRLLYKVSPQTTSWLAVSHAVRSATKGEQDVTYRYRSLNIVDPNTSAITPLRLEILGGSNFKSEKMQAYEAGFRTEVSNGLFIDVAAYYNIYTGLRVISPGAFNNNVQPYILSNDMHGHSLGGEIAVDWFPLSWWRLQGNYSYQTVKMHLGGTSTDTTNKGNAEGASPQHQASIRSGFDLSNHITFDTWLRGITRIDSIDNVSLPGYITLDSRLAWKPVKTIELALIGQNLLHSRQREFIPEYINTQQTEVPRSFYAMVNWKF